MTGAVQSPSIDPSAFSNLGFSDAALPDSATVRLSEPVMASRDGPSFDAQDRVFAGFEADWLSDGLQTNLAPVG
jgi:hypothetical protein